MSARSWFPWRHHRHGRHPVLQRFEDNRSLGERVADRVAGYGGSWSFIFLLISMIVGWMFVNSVVLERVIHHQQFDAYPYIALNLALSALAGLQAPIILMTQNRAASRDEALASHHYDETQAVEDLLLQNNKMTMEVRNLTVQVHALTIEVRNLLVARTDAPRVP